MFLQRLEVKVSRTTEEHSLSHPGNLHSPVTKTVLAVHFYGRGPMAQKAVQAPRKAPDSVVKRTHTDFCIDGSLKKGTHPFFQRACPEGVCFRVLLTKFRLRCVYPFTRGLLPCSARSTVLIAQNSPHMLQTSFSAGGAWLLQALTFSGFKLNDICPSQSRFFLKRAIFLSFSIAPGTPLAISAACAAIFDAISPSRTSSMSGSLMCSAGVT